MSAAVLALAGCGGERHGDRVLRMASADPAGMEHQPAVAYFAARVAALSGGRLRIAVVERWVDDVATNEERLVRDVAHGKTDLGWAHTRSFAQAGVDSFEALDAPMLVNGYAAQAAVLRSRLAARMLSGVGSVGLRGLALLAGPLSRPVGTMAPLRNADDLRGLDFGVRSSPVTDAAVRALGAHPLSLTPEALFLLYPGPDRHPATAALEDDLDSIYFDRASLGCNAYERSCATPGPWVATNVVLWPRTIALVANPRMLDGLHDRERGWVMRAASDAARHSLELVDQERRLVPELCAAGVRFAAMSPTAVAGLRRAWRPLHAQLERRPRLRSQIRQIAAMRHGAARDGTLAVSPSCRRRPRGPDEVASVRSPLPDGVYRMRTTATDLRAAGATGGANQPGTQTLTLRVGRWRLEITEPGRYVETGIYAGSLLRTTWLNDDNTRHDRAFMSIVVDRGGLRFHVVWTGDRPFYRATYASHRWRRIGD
jgi:TRAP-type C4-dicarboxylate transport system substrate-binding protein